MDYTKISKFIAYVLRHKPDEFGITLDSEGYMPSKDLVKLIKTKYDKNFSQEELEKIVKEDNKQRYSFRGKFNDFIRANQGHSTNQVNLKFHDFIPTFPLYHGTAYRFLDAIKKSNGLLPMTRQYVHLSKDIDTATMVGERHGKVVILEIDAYRMYVDGYQFLEADNGVILTKEVPYKYIKIIEN